MLNIFISIFIFILKVNYQLLYEYHINMSISDNFINDDDLYDYIHYYVIDNYLIVFMTVLSFIKITIEYLDYY